MLNRQPSIYAEKIRRYFNLQFYSTFRTLKQRLRRDRREMKQQALGNERVNITCIHLCHSFAVQNVSVNIWLVLFYVMFAQTLSKRM